jgi:RHS repeat-associated protein
MVIDKTGSLSGVRRHDYFPFGEEIGADNSWRTVAHGYAGDGVRQKFTGKERDAETGLDYFNARYYANAAGRFSSADPLLSSGRVGDPQSWNRYSYAVNNPLKYVDPTGLWNWGESAGGSYTDEQLEARRHDRSLSRKDRNAAKNALTFRRRFRDARDDAAALAQSPRLDTNQQAEVARAVNSYGTENDGNKVLVGFGRQGSGVGANTNGTAADDTIVVTFDLSHKGFGLIAEVAHEGSHVSDNQSFNLQHASGGTWDISQYETERRAYEVTSLVAQARGKRDYLDASPTYEVWNRGWKAAERETRRAAAIDRVISANYSVSRTNPGWTFGQIKLH